VSGYGKAAVLGPGEGQEFTVGADRVRQIWQPTAPATPTIIN
jgi:hypothetical protein